MLLFFVKFIYACIASCTYLKEKEHTTKKSLDSNHRLMCPFGENHGPIGSLHKKQNSCVFNYDKMTFFVNWDQQRNVHLV